MSRILLIHWNRDEAQERARKLSDLGHVVETLSTSEASVLRKVRALPPQLFVIDLDVSLRTAVKSLAIFVDKRLPAT